MTVYEIQCDICERTIEYKGCAFMKGIKIHLSFYKSVHVCEVCMKEIKEKVVNNGK